MFQKHLPGELELARQRVALANLQCVVKDAVKHFDVIGSPPMLFVGASHVSRLEEYVTNKNTPRSYCKPFENSFFIYVGGTNWEECLQHFCGEHLSPRQEAKEKGNQWLTYYKSKITPLYTVIFLCSNSIDEFDRTLKQTEKHTKDHDRFWNRANYEFRAAYNRLEPAILNVLRVIRANAPHSDLLYVKVLPRSWWHPLTRRLSRRIDRFITGRLRRTHRIKEIWIHEVIFDRVERKREIVLPGMLCTDETHLNNHGNQALCKAIMRPILTKWLSHKRKSKSNKF